MDNLYDNLENYEDENIVDELKKENSELKYKLEEYADAMDKLQKDFDNLSSEFKKLEMNYSSLLKTAKEEIKRKTLIITKLNTEKDMMVLNAIQNKNISGLRRSRWQGGNCSPFGKERSKDPDPDKVQSKEFVTAKPKIADDRKHSIHISSEERISNSTNDLTKSASRLGERPNSNNSDAKENVVEDAQVTKPKALSISNRRKSMPAIRSEAKFSTDEEGEDSFPTTDANYQKNHDIKQHKTFNKSHYDKNRLLDDRYRVSETSSMEDRYSGYQEHNKDYRNRNNRHYDSDRYRNRDKYDIHKNKRHFSPERHRRLTRNYLDEQNYRQDNNRMRVLRSPPPDRYHQYQRRNREGRNRYDHEEYYDSTKNRDRYQESYGGKHKLQNDEEEQCNKRRRNNSHNHYPEEDNRDGDGYPLPNCMPGEDLHHEYCQSPDYMVPEAGSTQPVREIRYTAVSQLEDPRLLSKRYILYKGDKDMLSTVTGRNVDLKTIDTSTWDVVHIDIPKALTRRPSQCSEDLVRNIYMDIDNPVSNMSVESGEIVSLDSDVVKAQDEVYHHSKQHNYTQVPHISTISEKPTSKDSSELKYKIPKIQKRNDTNQVKDNYQSNNDDKPLKTHSETMRVETRNTLSNINKQEPSNLSEKMQESNKFNFFSHKSKLKESNEFSFVVERPSLISDKYKFNDSKTTKQVSVECGLELSDETSDNIDVQKKFSISNEDVTLTNVTPSNEIPTSVHPTNVTVNIDVTKNTLEPSLEKNTEAAISVDTKEPKSKRRTEKLTTKAKCEETKTVKEKRNRPKKDKKDAKEIKTKFSELFGDTTSSLITPEDLGIMSASAQNQPSAKYVPICEDAQDAVDLLATETKNKQTDLPNLKPYKTNNLSGEVNIAIETEKKIVNHIKDKTNDGNKQRKSKKNEVEKKVSDNIETFCESPIDLPVLTEDLTKPMPTLTDEKNVLENNKPQNFDEAVSTSEMRNVLLHKPDILLKALATSTPQKELNDIPVSLPEINCSKDSKHDIVGNVGNSTVTESSFNNDTLDSQTDTDAPDVRIFVKRRRKIIKKAKPS